MNVKIMKLANSIKSTLEARLTPEQLSQSYVYQKAKEVIDDCNSGKIATKKIDIGAAAVKTFDSNSDDDKFLVEQCCLLAKLWNR